MNPSLSKTHTEIFIFIYDEIIIKWHDDWNSFPNNLRSVRTDVWTEVKVDWPRASNCWSCMMDTWWFTALFSQFCISLIFSILTVAFNDSDNSEVWPKSTSVIASTSLVESAKFVFPLHDPKHSFILTIIQWRATGFFSFFTFLLLLFFINC